MAEGLLPKSQLPNARHNALIESPVSDMIKVSVHVQDDGLCRDFELQLAECVEAYGFYRGQTKCEAMIHDLSECLKGEKRRSRNDIIYGEMTRQVENGERKYEKPPFLAFIR
ncbi:uncharacterized protein LOC108624651 [Ceratina calcarata]|uniref:Uncharacterized protein LOC108624651 n=1 Tax=Ceratina calcarata TaxID=156304 RepID=A0AAJ7IYD5_9HYME|nr:uncharacterized protein LOC108624651 [Ceratina calcarata]XP_017879576.1 uncharacterized protein LOC108624651 [Ceratina calcarata]